MQRVKVVYGDVRLVLPIYDESVKVREQIEIFGAVIGSYLGTDPVKIAVMKTSDSFTFRNEDTLSHVVRPEDVLHLVDYKEYIEEQYKYSFFTLSHFLFSFFPHFPSFFLISPSWLSPICLSNSNFSFSFPPSSLLLPLPSSGDARLQKLG